MRYLSLDLKVLSIHPAICFALLVVVEMWSLKAQGNSKALDSWFKRYSLAASCIFCSGFFDNSVWAVPQQIFLH